MGNCGSCNSCSGCGRELVLTKQEVALLDLLSQIPFLPVARKADSAEPVSFEPAAEDTLLLQCLSRKGLISIDYDKPLGGGYGKEYAPYPIKGSFALTARGQQVLEQMEIWGMTEEI